MMVFRQATDTNKTLFLTFITTYGVLENDYKYQRVDLQALHPGLPYLVHEMGYACVRPGVGTIPESDSAEGLPQNVVAGKKGGKIAKDARLALEAKTGKKVISAENFLPPANKKKRIQ